MKTIIIRILLFPFFAVLVAFTVVIGFLADVSYRAVERIDRKVSRENRLK